MGLGGSGIGWAGDFLWILNDRCRKELRWWLNNARSWLNMTLLDVTRELTATVFVDACNYGYGASTGLWGLWSQKELNWNIAIKEMDALRRTIDSLKRCEVVHFKVDNLVVFWCMVKGRSSCLDLNNLVKRIGGTVKTKRLTVTFEWIRSEDNMADWISRAMEDPTRD